jgi:tetratricopeptide (TPR) repeat protein
VVVTLAISGRTRTAVFKVVPRAWTCSQGTASGWGGQAILTLGLATKDRANPGNDSRPQPPFERPISAIARPEPAIVLNVVISGAILKLLPKAWIYSPPQRAKTVKPPQAGRPVSPISASSETADEAVAVFRSNGVEAAPPEALSPSWPAARQAAAQAALANQPLANPQQRDRHPRKRGLPEKPVVLVPVTAEDLAVRRRRIRLAVACAIVAITVGGGLTYKRLTDPVHAQESYEVGTSLLRIALNSQAILSFNRAIELNPAYADAYLMRGKSYRAAGNLEHAIADYSKVVKLRPSDPGPLLERGSAYLEQRNYSAAIADASRALDLQPKLALAYNLRGSAARGLGDLPRAVQDFDRAVGLQPNPDNYFQRGATYQLLSDHRRAIADFDEVIRFLPDKSPAYFARALSRRAIGDIEGAEQDHQRGRMLDGKGT